MLYNHLLEINLRCRSKKFAIFAKIGWQRQVGLCLDVCFL